MTLLPFERGIGFPPELNTFERITPRQVETMQQDLDDLVATARKGSSRNSNPLNHMRQRMRTIERNSHKLPALVGSSATSSNSSPLAPYRETAHIVRVVRAQSEREFSLSLMLSRECQLYHSFSYHKKFTLKYNEN